MVTSEQMDKLVEQLIAIEHDRFMRDGFAHQYDLVHWKNRGKKFMAVDIGTSGAWLIEKATGEIYNIKAYGVADYNKKKKADIGNIATVDPQSMHRKRWNYLR